MSDKRRIFITGGSRGIGLAIAKKLAESGSKITIAAKTDQPHESLPGTIHTAAEEIRSAGGEAFPIQCDIRDENQIQSAVTKAAELMGGIDVLINNASAINLTTTLETPAKRFDLIMEIGRAHV